MQDNNNKMILPIAIAGVVVLGGIGIFAMNSSKMDNKVMDKSMSYSSMVSSTGMMPVTSMMTSTAMMPEITQVGGMPMYANKDIVSNVVTAPNLSTLVTAVKAADLVATLQEAGPFTVFGPDNDAFAKVDPTTLTTLLKPENKAKLAQLLTFHVVSGKFDTNSLKDGQKLKTVQGGILTVSKKNGMTMINGVKIITPDVYQSNGVAHVIDTVLMPDVVNVGGMPMFANKDIVSNVVTAPNLSTLVTAVKAADLVTTLQGAGPFTVFGPDNDAFAKLPAGTVETLIKPENKTTLAKILTYHVVAGKLDTASLSDGQMLKTVHGGSLKVSKKDGIVMINGAKIVSSDVYQSNGVAHVIDSVMIPKDVADAMAKTN